MLIFASIYKQFKLTKIMNKQNLQDFTTLIKSNAERFTKCVFVDDYRSIKNGSCNYAFDICEFDKDCFSLKLVYGTLIGSFLLGEIMDYVRCNSLMCFLGVYSDGTAYIDFQ